MTGEIRPSNTETISPAGLSWDITRRNNWLYSENGLAICHILYTSKVGYMLYTHTGMQSLHATLAEAQAVAIALVAMRSK